LVIQIIANGRRYV